MVVADGRTALRGDAAPRGVEWVAPSFSGCSLQEVFLPFQVQCRVVALCEAVRSALRSVEKKERLLCQVYSP